MTTTEMVVIGLIILVLIAVAIWLYVRQRRSEHLRARFGPEYHRAIEEVGGARRAETELQAREKRVRQYSLRPLSAAERDRFAAEWRRIQSRFVDNPRDAAAGADNLLGQVMSARGYPDGDFDQRLQDLSVDHAMTVQNYRAAHEVALRHSSGQASTEDMRQAMIHYHQLFDDLVGAPEPARKSA